MPMYTVTIEGRDVTPRTLRVRVTEEQVEERMLGVDEWKRSAVAENIARDRACVRVWGRGCRWAHSGQGVAHRGQVWAPGKTGGEDARTGVITMRVE
jgi:hypothetical protein